MGRCQASNNITIQKNLETATKTEFAIVHENMN